MHWSGVYDDFRKNKVLTRFVIAQPEDTSILSSIWMKTPIFIVQPDDNKKSEGECNHMASPMITYLLVYHSAG
jgi:hypothetical protein